MTLGLICVCFLVGISLMLLTLTGFKLISLRGESMEPSFSAGSVLLSKSVLPREIRIGDVLLIPNWENGGKLEVVHRVVELRVSEQGLVVHTKGDNNSVVDPKPVVLDRDVGRIVLAVPYIGWIWTPTLGWWVLGFALLIVLLGKTHQTYSSRKARA